MRFSQPVFIYILPAVWLALAFILRHGEKRRQKLARQFSGEGEWANPGFSFTRKRWDHAFTLLIVTLLFIVLGRPMYFKLDERDELQGAPYLIALDVSRSMLATDMKPSRYGAATNALEHLFDEARGDRIGLITFAGVGYLNAPLTFDTLALKTILHYINPETLIDPGSSPAAALERAERFFLSNAVPEHVVILISDGEELDGKSIPLAARLHREQKMVIHTVGVGTASGSVLRVARAVHGATNAVPEIVSKLDETNLRRIAGAGGGRYFYLGQDGSGLRQLHEEVLRPLAEKSARNDLRNYRDCFQAPLALAILIFLVKTRWNANRFLRPQSLAGILEPT
jgi:Ca-activated chloride channel family protein